MTNKPLGRIPKNRTTPPKGVEIKGVNKKMPVQITFEELEHYKLCEAFINENGHFWVFEAYKDVVKHMENVENISKQEEEE